MPSIALPSRRQIGEQPQQSSKLPAPDLVSVRTSRRRRPAGQVPVSASPCLARAAAAWRPSPVPSLSVSLRRALPRRRWRVIVPWNVPSFSHRFLAVSDAKAHEKTHRQEPSFPACLSGGCRFVVAIYTNARKTSYQLPLQGRWQLIKDWWKSYR
jgi:hypothetical protein